jgi:hypothetical protein
MAFIRGSIAAIDPASPMAMGAMPVEGGTALVVPGLAQDVAMAATDKNMSVRTVCMVSS